MSIHSTLLRKTLVMLFLLAMTGTCSMNATEMLKIKKFEKKVLVEHKGVKFIFKAQIDYPVNDTRIQMVISEKLFGEGSNNVEAALDKYLQKFDKVEPFSGKKVADYSEGQQDIHVGYHGRNKMYFALFGDTTSITNYCETANSYASFVCIGKYKSNDNNEKTLTNAGVFIYNGSEYFTFDTEAGRLLTVGDVFAPAVITNASLDTNDTNLLIEPYADNLSVIRIVDGQMQSADFSLANDKELFTVRIKSLNDSVINQNRIKDEQLTVIYTEMQKQKDENKKILAYKRLLYYQSQVSQLKDIYLYTWGDTCFVSGVNKDINKMTEEEIDRLAANKGCGYIANEIRFAKKLMTDGKLDLSTDNLASKGIYYESVCDYVPIPPKETYKVIQKAPYSKLSHGESSTVLYIIGNNGEVALAVALDCDVPVLDKFYITKIRTLKNWIPGMKEGRNVSVVYNVSTTVKKEYISYPSPNLNFGYQYKSRKYHY